MSSYDNVGVTPHHHLLPVEGRPQPTRLRSVARAARKPPATYGLRSGRGLMGVCRCAGRAVPRGGAHSATTGGLLRRRAHSRVVAGPDPHCGAAGATPQVAASPCVLMAVPHPWSAAAPRSRHAAASGLARPDDDAHRPDQGAGSRSPSRRRRPHRRRSPSAKGRHAAAPRPHARPPGRHRPSPWGGP